MHFRTCKGFKLPIPLPVKRAAAASCLSPGIKVEVYAGSNRSLLSYEQDVDAIVLFLTSFFLLKTRWPQRRLVLIWAILWWFESYFPVTVHQQKPGEIVNKAFRRVYLCALNRCNSHSNARRGCPRQESSLYHLRLCWPFVVLLFLFFSIRRTKQESKEAFWATHQVLLPGGGSQRPTLPAVPRRSGQRERAVVGLVWKPSMKTSILCFPLVPKFLRLCIPHPPPLVIFLFLGSVALICSRRFYFYKKP